MKISDWIDVFSLEPFTVFFSSGIIKSLLKQINNDSAYTVEQSTT